MNRAAPAGTPRNPYPTVDVVIETPGGVVLIERAADPKGWALPGGFMDYGESPEHAARREVMEETGLTVELTELLGVYGRPDRDPRQHNISVVYVGRASGRPEGGDDAARAGVFALDALPPRLCFDHAEILADYLQLRRHGVRPAPRRDPETEATVLFAAVRDAIEAAVTGRDPAPSPEEATAPYQVPTATFVTLRNPDGTLRGCIGELTPSRPLVASLRHSAAGAALRDPRFRPVTQEEIEGLEIGISLLGLPRPADPDEVVAGYHGVIIERPPHRGVLLPEVAVDHDLDRPRLLQALCEKAGLPAFAWQDPAARLSVFTTRKLREGA